MNFKLFNYELDICSTKFTLKPLVGHDHSYNYSNMQLKEYCWYFIWLWIQVAVFKKA